MPRLLSNKAPEKSEAVPHNIKSSDIEKLNNVKSNKGQVVISSLKKSKDEMSSWEYYNFLMRFGKRKMDRWEWQTWKLKKD